MKNIEQLRADTPGTQTKIHFNNAGASLQPLPVIRAVREHLELETWAGGYEAADMRATEIQGFYEAIGQLLRANARNIAFASNATDAYARALSALPMREGDVVLTTENDYVSNQIAFLALQKRLGVRLLRARDTATGGVDVAHFEELLKKHRPVVAAVTHVPTNSGLVQPVEAIGQICREHGVWYLVDACQSAGQLPLDVQKIGCDFLSATMRKYLRGPRGTGFLFASDRVLEAGLEMLFPDMRGGDWTAPDEYRPVSDAGRFEYWEKPSALMLGGRAAVEYALEVGLGFIENRVKTMADFTRSKLAEIPGMRVLDQGSELCGIVTVAHPDWPEPAHLLDYLAKRHINCRITSLAVAQIDFARKQASWALRVSVHYYNTEAEVEALAEALRDIKP